MKAMVRQPPTRTIPRWRQPEMAAMANEIADHIPRMWLRSSSEDDFWRWYCGEVQSVLRNAADTKEKIRLHARLLAALSRVGLPQPPATFQKKC